MSQIENEVLGVLSKLILNEVVVLSLTDQALIAKWAVMTTIVAEFVDPESCAVSQEGRQLFYKRQVPPEGWRIWIGKMPVDGLAYDYKHTSLAVYEFNKSNSFDQPGSRFNTQLSAFVIKNLLIFAIKNPISVIEPVFSGELSRKMIRIFPNDYSFVDWSKIGCLPADAKNIVIQYIKEKYYYNQERVSADRKR